MGQGPFCVWPSVQSLAASPGRVFESELLEWSSDLPQGRRCEAWHQGDIAWHRHSCLSCGCEKAACKEQPLGQNRASGGSQGLTTGFQLQYSAVDRCWTGLAAFEPRGVQGVCEI